MANDYSANAPSQQSQCEKEVLKTLKEHPDLDVQQVFWKYTLMFGPASAPLPPSFYHDAGSGLTFKVESDGRRVSAFDKQGKLLWVRNPFVDSNLCPYRSSHPYIAWIGAPGDFFGFQTLGPSHHTPDVVANAQILKEIDDTIRTNKAWARKVERPLANDRFIGLRFNSSQMGYLNIRDGYYYFMGQN